LLGCFLFSGDDVFKKIKVLSGGEKSRVALAKAITSDANFLILDEPTNHLDIQSVNILIQALQQFEGTFVVVSHDRYLLDHVANKIWYIEGHQICEYPGTYAEYEEWQERREKENKNKISPVPEKKKEEKPKAQPANDGQQKLLKKLNSELGEIEMKVSELEVLKTEIEKELGTEDIYSDEMKLKDANSRYEKVILQLNDINREWERIAEGIMQAQN
jgi:ATP-binding cassette subfamily F protein 3